MYISRGDKTKRILNLLRHKARTAKEIINTLSPFSPDTYKVTKRLLGHMDAPKFNYQKWKREEEKRFYMLLAKLRKDDIVKKQSLDVKTVWKLTAKGLKKLLNYEHQQPSKLPKKVYERKEISIQMLFIFDIPEQLKHYRSWLRHQLKSLGFAMLQKSVWIGNYAVPADFIHDLRELNILKYIHIFKISKSGSMTVK
ncbi:MAG: hypothetical protein A3I89_03145 [Candidatus Harrisonbacteria bacterium RIFCSPLOWO2_02_FULL_41_11]|uniref:Transcriptional repressor PaaX-like central Cas2-like domain-containing protein n=1 Tax=Candidatus Harrisonbacteria bacterium RIFCSPHIGHO2_02_FULL_42_16 TaxID=1798404 RepID=A0A1G1ZIK0_9BACT|nr:MAG: hypothetical protein A3B92_02635 [Candidatus Harrisonbacteria bacterium RIFCSPHIGHO2_02_FULL_42_16]OGY66234.1 MAG: hypothetical protein A3I89_03145 [Candidatus Harrisonbacteria bacterium RIFCSPLOWO2_02_FULL_41_11]